MVRSIVAHEDAPALVPSTHTMVGKIVMHIKYMLKKKGSVAYVASFKPYLLKDSLCVCVCACICLWVDIRAVFLTHPPLFYFFNKCGMVRKPNYWAVWRICKFQASQHDIVKKNYVFLPVHKSYHRQGPPSSASSEVASVSTTPRDMPKDSKSVTVMPAHSHLLQYNSPQPR